MTYHSDPTRWTQSPGDAPELLRGGLEAASHEGPSDLQMRTLALKLAAVGTGAAVAVGAAAGAKASTTAAGAGLAAATGGSFSLAKIAVGIALIGAAAGGSFLLRQPSTPVQANLAAPVVQQAAPAARVQVEEAPRVEAPVAAAAPVKLEQAAAVLPEVAEVAAAAVPAATVESTQAELSKAGRRERRHARAAAAPEQHAVAPVAAPRSAPAVENVVDQKAQLSEIDLLSKARAALAARPRDAYRLTEEHKALYPQGMFGQERDALAVEALQRAGDLKHARELAEVFVKRYPSSPHAHRFRETMNLP